ncbi:unnamed protein product [Leptosia nina]|uniref:Uncharacterized protein n=1 Tax=Leptosia nina TaxID=320188 RepID=A0AAV1K519_9NEOP
MFFHSLPRGVVVVAAGELSCYFGERWPLPKDIQAYNTRPKPFVLRIALSTSEYLSNAEYYMRGCLCSGGPRRTSEPDV